MIFYRYHSISVYNIDYSSIERKYTYYITCMDATIQSPEALAHCMISFLFHIGVDYYIDQVSCTFDR